MQDDPTQLRRREIGQWGLTASRDYGLPFVDVDVEGTFAGPSGREFIVPGFYDGDRTWRVRFSPGEAGRWSYRIASRPDDAGLTAEGAFQVTPSQGRGFLRPTPGRAWGFHFESGEPVLVFGDTTYNLFGMAHCGGPVEQFLERRAGQGINVLRVRLPVSPFHGPDGYSDWQTRRTWPWGGSEQSPQFDRFNLDYFRTVDRVLETCERLGMGLEMVMEAWGFEFPFSRRDEFVAEWELLWLRYLIARYDAYASVWFWTLMNEYEYYPNGDWRYQGPLSDLWATRIGRWVKRTAPHGHVVSVHNGPGDPPFAERFRKDPGAVDHVMFQTWGTTDEKRGWLAAGIEEAVAKSLAGWRGTAVLAEYGYERDPELDVRFPGHLHCDVDHTRRGGWRSLFCGLGVIHGWEHSWGPWMILERDQEGMPQFLLMRRFFREVVPFDAVRPAPGLVRGEYEWGRRPSALASEGRDLVAVYLPTGGRVELDLPAEAGYAAQWFDTRTGGMSNAEPAGGKGALAFVGPEGGGDRPWDWVLVLRAT
ncbi:MAG: hypothetical protein AMK73_02695 [Planctomycetes bacterium SM23_32]|nr:MAG: hypothetical protein AMK73_02695 [Planctomycetes bacterium SM23_32]